MTRMKRMEPRDKISLSLTAAERKLLIDLTIGLPGPYMRALESKPASGPLVFKLSELAELAGYVEAASLHAPNARLQKKLDAVLGKVERLLDACRDNAAVPLKLHKPSKSKPLDPSSGSVYQFKITLQETHPPIWRRIQVQDCTLDKLHEHIQTAMGWTNSHLHQFEIDDRLYANPQCMDDGFDDSDSMDSTKTRLSKILAKKDRRFRFCYEYDFGDSWRHQIAFEGCVAPDPKNTYPLCIDGARACPPEDVGGVWGFDEFLQKVSNPKHPEHQEMLEWCGPFDPEDFDSKAATKAMRKGSPGLF